MCARNLPFAPEKMVMCPPHSMLNFAPNQQHRSDYATGAWEGSSAEPMLDENNNLIGINVILHRPRLARFMRSLRARGYSDFSNRKIWSDDIRYCSDTWL